MATTKFQPVPGEGKSVKKHMLELGSDVMQSFDPIKKINLHLCGFAFYKDDPSRQLELHHYCSHQNEDFAQAAVYDSDKSDARLIGIEYVISERLFNTLAPEEQKYWHSHSFDVTSGSFIAPGLPLTVDHTLAKDIIKTYGKTFITWQVDKDALPLGEPKLMMVATQEGQWNPALFEDRARRMKHDVDAIKKERANLEGHGRNPNSDWGHFLERK